MKVVLVWNGPADAAARGILVRRELPLVQQLMARGVRPTLLLLGDPSALAPALADAGIAVEVLPAGLPPAGAALRRLPAITTRLRGRLRALAPDLVEGDDVMPAIAVGLAARADRQVVVYRRHHDGGRTRLLVASRIAARLAHRTVVSSETMRHKAAADDRVPLDHIEVASSGTAAREPPTPATLRAARQALGLPDDALIVGVVARLRREKGIDVLLDALDRLGDLRHVHVVIVGTGPEADALRRRAERAPLPVHFLGHRDDVERWIAIADLIAMPSRRESLGRVTLEAMAAGRPLVASRVGGLVEAVEHGVTGLLVPPDDPPALAGALRALVGDPARARAMGEAARARHASRYTLGHMAAAWVAAWERALGSAAAGAARA